MSGLTRARTMPTKRSAPMGTSVRRGSASAKSKSSRASSIGAKRQASVKSKNAKQAYDAATMAVMDMREEKYFDVSADLQSYPQAPTEGPKRVSVLAFATTSNLEQGTTTGVVETYCGHNIQNLNMLRPFHTTKSDGSATPANLLPYMIDGKHVFPTKNSVSWQINRNYAIVGPTFAPDASLYKLANIENCLAVRCRVIRVTPKIAPGVTTAIAPTTDLFLDQHGLPYSPSSSDFSYSDAEFASVNRRKYTVLQDSSFTLTNPLVQFSEASMPDTTRLTQIPVMQPQGSHTKKMVTRHQLSAKKGGAVFYNDPAAEVNATTGHRREYVFMHFWFENSDGGKHTDANPVPPIIGTDNVVPDSETIKVHWRTESRFKEA